MDIMMIPNMSAIIIMLTMTAFTASMSHYIITAETRDSSKLKFEHKYKYYLQFFSILG